MEPVGITVKDASTKLSVCQATIYNLMNAGKLDSFTVGRKRLIKITSIQKLVGEAA
jgi:excisionase family DNA binding protein